MHVFVHVSDIHFHYKWRGGRLDRDERVYDELIRAAAAVVSLCDSCTGILVKGDIAYHGRPDKFRLARELLEERCKEVRCEFDSDVWTVPGNHDIQRPESAESPVHGENSIRPR